MQRWYNFRNGGMVPPLRRNTGGGTPATATGIPQGGNARPAIDAYLAGTNPYNIDFSSLVGTGYRPATYGDYGYTPDPIATAVVPEDNSVADVPAATTSSTVDAAGVPAPYLGVDPYDKEGDDNFLTMEETAAQEQIIADAFDSIDTFDSTKTAESQLSPEDYAAWSQTDATADNYMSMSDPAVAAADTIYNNNQQIYGEETGNNITSLVTGNLTNADGSLLDKAKDAVTEVTNKALGIEDTSDPFVEAVNKQSEYLADQAGSTKKDDGSYDISSWFDDAPGSVPKVTGTPPAPVADQEKINLLKNLEALPESQKVGAVAENIERLKEEVEAPPPPAATVPVGNTNAVQLDQTNAGVQAASNIGASGGNLHEAIAVGTANGLSATEAALAFESSKDTSASDRREAEERAAMIKAQNESEAIANFDINSVSNNQKEAVKQAQALGILVGHDESPDMIKRKIGTVQSRHKLAADPNLYAMAEKVKGNKKSAQNFLNQIGAGGYDEDTSREILNRLLNDTPKPEGTADFDLKLTSPIEDYSEFKQYMKGGTVVDLPTGGKGIKNAYGFVKPVPKTMEKWLPEGDPVPQPEAVPPKPAAQPTYDPMSALANVDPAVIAESNAAVANMSDADKALVAANPPASSFIDTSYAADSSLPKQAATVICTALHDLGYIDARTWTLSERWSVLCVDRETYEGYMHWATPVAQKIREKHWFYHPVFKFLGTRWAKQMAHEVSKGRDGEKSVIGYLCCRIGTKISKAVGRRLNKEVPHGI